MFKERKMIIKNNTANDYIAVIEGREYTLNGKSSINVLISGKTDIEIRGTQKDSVHLDFLDIILGLFMGDSTYAKINTDYHFTASEEYGYITIKDNVWYARDQLTIEACCAEEYVTNESYTMPGLRKAAKKHKLLHLLVTSLPVVPIVLIILCFISDPPALWIVLFVLWFIIYGLPSFGEIKKFRKTTKPDFVNEKLCEFASRRRTEGDSFNSDSSAMGKFMTKILDKMFKPDEDK